MKIDGVNPNNIVKFYSQNKKSADKKEQINKSDSVQISSLGKSLSAYSSDGNLVNSSEKIEGLRNEVASGTYNRDSKLVAAKIIEEMKNK